MHYQIAPHGNELVNRVLTGAQRDFWLEKAATLPTIDLDKRKAYDVMMIADGAYSPLEGFMGSDDYFSVLNKMRLQSGLPWPIPIVLGVTPDRADEFDVGGHIALRDASGLVLAILHLREKFKVNKELELAKIYRTTNPDHPSVKYLLEERGDVLLAGPIDVINRPADDRFAQWQMTPAQTRRIFKERGWSRIAAFQTHNPILRSHEYMMKTALELCDGLLLHPLRSTPHANAVPTELRMQCYEQFIEHYLPEERVLLAVFPTTQRFAGPRETVLHAIVHKNYGCSHFIVGYDHAGWKDYYNDIDTTRIFRNFGPAELGIQPMFFDRVVYCTKCKSMVTAKTCPHGSAEYVSLTCTEVREMRQKGMPMPEEFIRPEIAELLTK